MNELSRGTNQETFRTKTRKMNAMTKISLNDRIDRRGFARLLGGAAMAVTAGGVLLPREASAGIGWCRADPWVVINGVHLHVYPERDGAAANLCNGPIRLRFWVPKNASYQVLEADAGFGYGYDIQFQLTRKYSQNEYGIEMYVPASSDAMAVRLVCEPVDPTALITINTGVANSWFAVTTKI